MTDNPSRHQRLRGLYAITDQHLIPEKHFTASVQAALEGGARILQYRDKSSDDGKRLQQARQCRQLCERYDALLIINDDIALALSSAADGVHLGKYDNSLTQARAALGSEAIIGISCYDDIERAIDAQSQGADYVAFGAMFSSGTKPEAVIAGPDIIPSAKQHIDIPICTIGGIDTDNASQVVAQGADMIAVISTLFAAEDINLTARLMAGYFS